MSLKEIFKNSKSKNTFTIISDNETTVLLFEGKTVLAGQHEDFHSGHEDAFFDKKKVKGSWNSALELYSKIIKQFKKNPNSMFHYDEVSENLFSFLEKNNLYCTDDYFLP